MSLEKKIIACLYANKVPYLSGPPGVGKTAMVKTMAHKLGAELSTVYLASVGGTEIHGLPILNEQPFIYGGQEYRRVVHAPPHWAFENEGKKRIIFFDELNHLSPSDLGIFMSIPLERLVGSLPLDAETIGIIAAGNPPEMSAGGWNLPAPVRRRFVQFEVRADAAMFSEMDAFPANWGMPLPPVKFFGVELSEELRRRYRGLIAAYVKSKPNCFELPKDLAKLAEGYFCPATAADVADLLASIDMHFLTEEERERGSIKSDAARLQARSDMLSGCCGGPTAADIMAFLDMMDMPDPKFILDNPDMYMSTGKVPEPDKLYYLLLSLGEYVRVRTQKSNEGKAALTKAQQNWQAALRIAAWLQKNNASQALICMFVGYLVTPACKPRQAIPPAEVDELVASLDVLKASGLSWVTMGEARPEN